MAAKTTPAPATNADGKGQASVQIMQVLVALTQKVEALQITVNEIKASQATENEGLKQVGIAVTAIQHGLGTLGDQVKAAAGAKRTPKPPGTGNVTGDGTTGSTVPTGEKPPSTSFIWFELEYRKNPASFGEKYFTEDQVTAVKTKLSANETYTKLDITKGTPEQQAKAKFGRATMEAKELVALIKADSEKKNKLKSDYDAMKSAFEAKNRTAATKDGDAAPATGSS